MAVVDKIVDETQDSTRRRNQNRVRADHREVVSKTIRNTREILTSDSGHSVDFDRDILIAHARNFRSAGFVIPWLTLIMAIIALTWHNYFYVMMWMSANLITQVLVIYQNNRFLKAMPRDKEELKTWHQTFICGDLLSGLMWSMFVLIPVMISSLSQPVFIFTTMLVVIAIYSFITAPIFVGMLTATTPISMLLFLKFSQSGYISLMMMSALFIGAQFLFILVGKQVKDTLLRMFAIKAEKDSLILELEEATAISNESRRRAEESNLAKSRFLATMSHELRTPLNAILGFSEIMKGELLGPLNNPSYKEYVTDIHSSGDHLLNLINEILDLSRIEAGRYELKEDAVYLLEVIEDCVNLMQLRAKNKKIRIEIISETDLPRLWVDERAMRQIILNLTSNAVKFTPQGGHIQVIVGWTAGGGQYITVRDNGPGIPEEEIPIVLSQFGQGSLAIKSAEQGTGLGLPICQALINMHGGTFDLESKLRVGTSITTSLPRSRVMEALAPVSKINTNNVSNTTANRVMQRRSA